MSKYSSAAPTSAVFDIQTKSLEDIIDAYGIEVDDDGTVYDPCEMKEFPTLAAWAAYMDGTAKQDTCGFEKRHGKHYYDEE